MVVSNLDKEILELLKTISSKLDEHTQILRALEHSSEAQKSEIDRLNHGIARVEGEVKGIREDLTAVELMTSKNWNDIAKLKSVK
jgi:predicted  nucleic acid-binding Zn-ribbon protein